MTDLTVPSPADYPDFDTYIAAYDDYRRRANDAADADLLARIAAAGGRTTVCPCGYGPFDSCPACDA